MAGCATPVLHASCCHPLFSMCSASVLTPLPPRQGNLPASGEAGVLGAAVGAGRAGEPDGLAAAASHGGELIPAAGGWGFVSCAAGTPPSQGTLAALWRTLEPSCVSDQLV